MSTGSFVSVRGEKAARRLRAKGKLASAACNVEWLERRVFLTTVLSPVADTYIRNHSYSDTNFGASPSLYIKNASAGDTRIPYLKFDLSGIGSITSATLRVTGTLEFPEATPVDMNVYPVADTSWVEGDGTINSRNGNGTDTDNSPAGEMTFNNAPPIGSMALATSSFNRYGFQTYSFDLTSYLQQQKAVGNNLVSLALNTSQQGELWQKILSRESGAFGPQLVINGTGPTAPTASVSAADVTNPGATTQAITVVYSGDAAVNPGTIDAGDITVSGPAGNLPVTDVSVSGTGGGGVVATYTVAVPGGGWNALDNGFYTVQVQPNQVLDANGGAAIPSEGTFRVHVSDTTQPTASISAGNVNSAASTYQFSVTFNDDVAIDTSWVDVDNVGVTGPNGPLKIIGATVDNPANGTPRTATYTVAAPNGAFSPADNGNYTIEYRVNQVRDTAGNPAIPTSTTFNVAVPAPPSDTTPPTARITAGDVNSGGGATETVTVVYSDNVAVNAGSIDVGDLSVTGPGGPLTVTGVQINPASNAAIVTATYTVAAPGGSWDSSDNGSYTVSVNNGQVTDVSGNPASGTPEVFRVNVPVPDTTPPSASISAPDVTSPGGTSEAVVVTYTDNTAIDVSSIGTGNIVVTGPGGRLAVMGVNVSASGNNSSVTAIYTVAAPGGSWGPSDNGTYTVALQGGTVRDTSGNGVGGASANFTVNATLPDTIPPAAQIMAPDITAAGAAAQTITVVYTDNVAVNAATIDTGDITVTGPSGPLTVTAASASGGSGSPLVVTYAVAAPSGGFTSAANGSYTVTINANQVADTSGNFAGGESSSFTVNITAPITQPTPDPTFNNGSVVTNFTAESIVTQPDGKIVVAGRMGNLSAGQSQGVIERLNPDGSLDRSFGNAGQVISRQGVNEAYYTIILQGPSNFLVAGMSDGDFVVARYDFNGDLDPTFGTAGRTLTDFGTSADAARGLTLAPDGSIVAAGDSGGNFAFARYDANGHLDRNFAQAGRQLFALDSGQNAVAAVAVQSDGKIVAAGADGGSVAVVRLTAAGEVDGSFGTGGLVLVRGLVARTDNGPDHSEALALQDGQILVANRTASGHFGMVRLDGAGNVDTSFGTNGIAVANFGGDDDADSIVVQQTGEIVVVGTSLSSGTANTALAEFDPNGNLIPSFGTGGTAMFPADVTPASRELHIGDIVLRAFGASQNGGRIIIGTSDEAVTSVINSRLRRVQITDALVGSPNPTETLLGMFGTVNGKKTKLVVTTLDNTRVTFTLTGGTGMAFQDGDRIHLVINDAGRGVVLTITTRGGAGRVSLSDVMISGNVKSITAKTADLFGHMTVTGVLGKATLGNISGVITTGGTLSNLTALDLSGNISSGGPIGKLKLRNVSGEIASAAGAIGAIQAASMANARVLSGANLGEDGMSGGTGADADTYAAGSIGAIKVTGAITSSFIGAGVDPVDRTFGNADDASVGGASSAIHSITAKSADSNSRFEAGAFGKIKMPKPVSVLNDPRFRVLA